VGEPRGVGHEGVDDDHEFAGAQRLGDAVGVGQHGHRVARGDPDRAHRRVLGGEDLLAEQRLAERARRDLGALDEAEVEGAASLVVEAHPAARDAQVAGDGGERVERAHDRAARLAPAHAPADQDRARLARAQALGQTQRLPLGHVGVAAPLGDRARHRQRAKVVQVVAVAGRLGVDPVVLEEQARHRHGEGEVAGRTRR
jgi:hypothetical protein